MKSFFLIDFNLTEIPKKQIFTQFIWGKHWCKLTLPLFYKVLSLFFWGYKSTSSKSLLVIFSLSSMLYFVALEYHNKPKLFSFVNVIELLWTGVEIVSWSNSSSSIHSYISNQRYQYIVCYRWFRVIDIRYCDCNLHLCLCPIRYKECTFQEWQSECRLSQRTTCYKYPQTVLYIVGLLQWADILQFDWKKSHKRNV